jgi:hypothetical protein
MLLQIMDKKFQAFSVKDFVPVLMSKDSCEISCSHSGVTGDSTVHEMTLCWVCSSHFHNFVPQKPERPCIM